MQSSLLIGTWADATWTIDFCRRNGYTVIAEHERNLLLRKYWSVPVSHIETSAVLAHQRWMTEVVPSRHAS